MSLTKSIQLTGQVMEKRQQHLQTAGNVLRRMGEVKEGLQYLEDTERSDTLTFMYAVPDNWRHYNPWGLSYLKRHRFGFEINDSVRKSFQTEGMLNDPVYYFLREGYNWACGRGRDTHIPTHNFFYKLDGEVPEYIGIEHRSMSMGGNLLELLYEMQARTMDKNTYTALRFVVDSLIEQGFLRYQKPKLQTGLTVTRRAIVDVITP